MNGALLRKAARIAEARAQRRRLAVAAAMQEVGAGEARIEGQTVRLSGPGLLRRWWDELALREAGRGEP